MIRSHLLRRALVAVSALALAASACRSSSEPIPPSLPLIIPEPERPAQAPAPAEDAAAAAATRVISPSGDDDARGTTDAPWRTLAHAAAEVRPGDTVRVRPGSYQSFVLEQSGEPDRPIRFLAEPGTIIDDPTHLDGINLEEVSHVEIRGFRVRGAERAGIRAVECAHVTIRDNVVEKNGKWGILTGFCDDLQIIGNEASRSREQHGIYVGNTSARPQVKRNAIWGNRLAGLHLNGDVHMGREGVITEAKIVGNVIHGNGRAGAAGINLDGVRNALIANNLLYANGASGIAVYRIDGGAPSTGNAIVHNTVVMPPKGARWAILLRDGATHTALYHNIVVSEDPRRGAIAATRDSLRGLESDANLLTGRLSLDGGDTIIDLAAWREHTGQDGHSRAAPAAEAIFVDASSGDFRPGPDSPARGAGRPLPDRLRERLVNLTAEDLAGRARPDAPDLGCFQLAASAARPDAAGGDG